MIIALGVILIVWGSLGMLHTLMKLRNINTVPSPSTRCRGLWGSMAGHRFDYPGTYTLAPSQHCIRCGMPRGGWKS